MPGTIADANAYAAAAAAAGNVGPITPAAPPTDTIHTYNAGDLAEIQRRSGKAPTFQGAPIQAGQTVAFNPVYGSQFQNSLQSLGHMPTDQNIPENFIQNMRARLAANAAAQTVFEIDPATGQARPRNAYSLSATDAAHDPLQNQANNALLAGAGATYMNAQGAKTALPGQAAYQSALAHGGSAAQNVMNQQAQFGGVNTALAQGGMATQGVGQAASQVPGADTLSRMGQQSQLGQYGQDLGLLRATANGTGPSAAQHMLQGATDANMRAQLQMAGAARGGNIASAYRSATQAGAQAQQQSASQLGALRAQEQLQGQAQLAGAQSQLAGALSGMRTQDQGQAMNQVAAAAQYANAAQAQTGAQLAGYQGRVQGAMTGATAQQQQTAAQAGLTQAQQGQYALGLQEQGQGLQYQNAGVQNQLGMQQIQAMIAQAAASGDQNAMNNALQYYQLAQSGQIDWQNITQHVADQNYQRTQMEAARKDAQIAAAAGAVGGIIQGGMSMYGSALAGGRA